MKNESFVFYATWDECLAILAPAQRAALYRAIVNKARFGIDLDDDAPRALRAIMSLISPQIEANRERYQKCVEQGCRGAEGGRPRKSATAAADAKSAATASKSAASTAKSAGSAAKSAASVAKSATAASKSAASAAKFDAAASAPVASALPEGWGGPVHEPSAGRAAVVENPVSDVEIPVSEVENPVSDVEIPVSNVEFPASPVAGYPLETAVTAMRDDAVPMLDETLGYQRETESKTPGVNSETLNDNGYDNDNVNEFGVKKEREKEKGIDGAPCGEWVAGAPALSKSAPKLGEDGHGLPAAASLNAQPASPDTPSASPDALAASLNAPPASPDTPPAGEAAPPVAAGAAPDGAPPASAAAPPKPKKKSTKAKSKEMAAAAAGLASLWRAQKARLDLPARQAAFWEDVQREGSRKHVAADTLRAFWMYWGELCGGGRMRCEREKTWQTSMRLGRWAINQRSYDRRAAVPPAEAAVAAPVVREAGREGLMAGCGFRSPAVLPEAALGAPTGILRF